MKQKQINELEESTVVAFLSLKGFQVIPFKRDNGRIVFKVEGDISKPLQDLYSNESIPILDYLKALKTVRGSIFTLKAIGVQK